MNSRFYILFFSCLVSSGAAQVAEIDTAFALSFYPMQIGNYWEYCYFDYGGDDYCFSIKITGDTLMDNGKVYKIFKTASEYTNNPWWVPTFYERVDSLTGWIYQYDLGKRFESGEFKVDSLFAKEGDNYYGGRYSFTPDDNETIRVVSKQSEPILDIESSTILLKEITFIPTYEYKLGEGFGLVYFWSHSTITNLTYCKIDGVEYGTPANVLVDKHQKSPSVILLENYPNPFNNCTKFRYILSRSGQVDLSVYNLNGELVKNLVDGFLEGGEYTNAFNSANLSSGIYWVCLKTDKQILTRKISLIR